LIEQGIADPQRLGITGFSYGGYGVLATVVSTNRFKAAVVQSGSVDLIGMVYGTMSPSGTAMWAEAWAENGQGRMGAPLWDRRERYIENSPIFYLDRVTTPVLAMCGVQDEGVTPTQGNEIFVALRRLGKEVEYAKYFGEGHGVLGWAKPLITKTE
jgi:dipeptidyl aminopeptidase/acylaminoacyl peptidase